MATTEKFEEAYKKLNAKQKEAVDTVEGPVLVVAGPGTGKTHILTLRIANILRTTQARPDAILALTFTDSAARTMRRRLAALIGEETSRKVTISTFHGFAELVRSEYPDSFALESNRRLMGDVEETLLLREAIDSADIDLLRPAKAPYTYLRDLGALYDALSREGMTLDAYRAWGQEARKALEADESLCYKRGEHEGELTKAGQEKVARYDKVEEAVLVLERYQELKEVRGLADFSDMLTGVVTRIESDEGLRSDLQERYQYLLADEHQDANALQHRLLELFAIDDFPNLFVVGDERQAIYRFQGAEAGAFAAFTKLFPRTAVIELESSFRSHQHILDVAHEVVADTGAHAPLAAARGGEGERVSRIVADDPLDERARVAALVQKLIRDGAQPHEIAVIARTNDTADLFASVLVARGLPVLRAGDLSLTERPIMRALLALMTYSADPTQLGSLREALLAPWWNLPIPELLAFLRMTNDREFVKQLSTAYPDIAHTIGECVKESLVKTPIACFSYIFTESGARDYFLSHAEHLDDITLVRALMMHLESVVLLTESTTFAEAFVTLARAREHGLSPVKVSVTEREGFITVITAHKAKGMEFRYVIVPDCTENAWEKGGRAPIIPSPFENKQTLDDARRLFYVALTRAKDEAFLSYALTSAEGRERAPTSLMPVGLSLTEIAGEPLPLLHATVAAPEKIRALVERYLETESLSPSAVNDYLESPALFFARRVLRIQEPPVPALVYGNAIHAALAAALQGAPEEESYAALERAFSRSLLPRDATFEKLRSEAREALAAALPALAELGTPAHVEKSFSLTLLSTDKPVTLAGKIDAAFVKDGRLFVTDFKTGSEVSSKNADYARQLALYAALLDANKEPVTEGMLLGVSRDGIKKVSMPVGKEEQKAALAEVALVIEELRSGHWRRGAASEYDALLTLLAD
ncbi:MAG: ATP-dependent DNA helicase [Minisyncoccia bacterium]